MRPFVLIAAKWLLVVSIWASVVLAVVVGWYAWDLPDVERLQTPSRRPSVTLISANGTVIATHGDLYGGPVTLEGIPPFLVQAVIATEDRRFFEHFGIDFWALARAMYVNLRSGSIRQGGSTLTQQLAKNLFLTRARTIRRKVQELLLAFWLEANFSKRQILTIYLNRVYLGAGTYGLAAAAQRYFAKPVRALTLHEAAVIVGLLKAPARYSPVHNPDAAKGRAGVVLQNMVAAGYLSPAGARRAARQALRFRRPASQGGARYFADWILERASGYVGHTSHDLVIVTTLDGTAQTVAEQTLRAALERDGERLRASQGALVALTPDGAVRAMIGGRDYRKSQFNRATQALRQPGSAFKLFVYLAGMEAGIGPDDVFIDRPVNVGRWRPKNYSRRYRGPITVSEALAKSVNSVAVQVSERVGRSNVIAVARRLGITTRLTTHPSLALGASEARLLELTAAYGTIANGGYSAWPYGIIEIRDSSGSVLFQRSGSGGGRVVAPEHVESMHRMLSTVIAEGTGRGAGIGRPAAGKTGTSQEFRDAWFIGYTPALVAGVWIGNDNNAPMKKVTGGGLPARIWRGFMTRALKEAPRRSFAVPNAPGLAATPDGGWRNPDYQP